MAALAWCIHAVAGHSDSLPHPHADVNNHPHHERCTCMLRQIFPLGGPVTGNTAVTITGHAFQDLGDVKCRFGVDEVQARVVNETIIECSSPGCASPTCIAGQEEKHVSVPLEVSMNGVSFTGSGLQYTYYDMRHVHISRLDPSGGPSTGGTAITVWGVSFRDLTSGAGGVHGARLQGIKCKYGTNDMVHATRKRGSLSVARCAAPIDASWPTNASGAAFTGLPLALHPVPLELTFNGYDTIGTLSTSHVPYTYYDPVTFNTSWLHPLGGPMRGGTEVSIYLTDNRLLTDLGGGNHGVLCRFTHTIVTGELGHQGSETVHAVVNGSLANCNGARKCGAGWAGITCRAPSYDGPLLPAFDGADVRVEVSINGQDFTDGGVLYRYYDPAVWKLHRFHPRGGPLIGNSSMSVSGLRFQPLGDVRCRFGVLNAETNASISAESHMECLSPPHWHQQASQQTVDLQITLNGQDYLETHPHNSHFTYYALDESPTGLAVLKLDPPGGPEAGGTLVRLTGSGFIDLGGLLCKFDLEPAVQATLIDQEHVLCTSPPRVADASDGGTYDPRSVEVTVNSQLHHITSSAIPFAYYKHSGLHVSRVYPRGGPVGGGTAVTVWGVGFRDQGHGNHSAGLAGLHCRFGTSLLVPASLQDSLGGEGPQRLTCASPSLGPSDRCETVIVRVTNNANNPEGGTALTSDDVGFTYYENFENADVGSSTPGGQSLGADPLGWTGNDIL